MATILRDHFGTVDRLRKQDEKDAAEIAEPVRSIFSGGREGTYLALRPIEERVAARANETDTSVGRGERVRRAKRRARSK